MVYYFVQTRINMQYPKGKCIKIFGTQIPPPSRGNFYALTREVKFQRKDYKAPYPRFCINMQFMGLSIHLFHFNYF